MGVGWRSPARVELDENLPDSAIALLTSAGHDVDTARARGLRGANDLAVRSCATADHRLLLTSTADLVVLAYPPGTHGGMVAIRLGHPSPRVIHQAVERISANVDLEGLRGWVAVWRDGDLRVRRLRSCMQPPSGVSA